MIRSGLILFVLFLSLWGTPPDLKVGFYDATTYAMRSAYFRIGIEVWIKAFTQEQNLTIQTRYYDNPAELARDFENGKIDMAVATPLVFVKYFNPDTLSPGIVGYAQSKQKSMNVLLLVRKNDRYKNLDKLLRKKIAIPQVADAIHIYIRTLSLKKGLKKPGEFILTKGESQAIYKLFFHKADMAAVTEGAFETACELNPQIKEELSVYRKFHLYIGNFAFLRKEMDPKIKRLVTEQAIKKLNTVRGKEVLLMFGCKIVDSCTPDDLESTRKIYREYLQLKKRKISR